MRCVTASILLSLMTLAAHADELPLGAALPAQNVTLHTGETVDLAATGAEGYLLVYFYPKADTPGCTAQACSLRDAYAQLTKAGIKVFGVSMDDVAAQAAFHEEYNLPFPLVADPEGTLVEAFGVPKRWRFASRQAYLFQDGQLVWRDLSASTKRQADDVLAFFADKQK